MAIAASLVQGQSRASPGPVQGQSRASPQSKAVNDSPGKTKCKVGRGNSGHGVIRATSTSGQR